MIFEFIYKSRVYWDIFIFKEKFKKTVKLNF